VRGQLLIVEDNAELRENLADVLEVAGHTVKTSAEAKTAVDQADPLVDVALVDVKLPDGSGYDVTRALKAARPLCEVILLTGYASSESTTEAVRAGAWAWMSKPFSTPDLLQRIDQALAHVAAKREAEAAVQRARVAERLAAAGTVTAGLSHEIRNPLNAAALQLSVLERRIKRKGGPDEAELLEPLSLARDEIRRVDRLLTEFLQLARPESLRAQPVPMRAFLERTAALFSASATERKVALEVACPDGLAASADREKLQQVVTNLVLNAFEALEKGGRVRLSAEASGSEVRLDVDDDGPGVPAEVAKRIFEPFFTTKARGTGLGLAISHQQVLLQGGRLTVGRGALGGARFSVFLPRAAAT
jgi:two-component system, NtrC family, sensor histidine kinase HydH